MQYTSKFIGHAGMNRSYNKELLQRLKQFEATLSLSRKSKLPCDFEFCIELVSKCSWCREKAMMYCFLFFVNSRESQVIMALKLYGLVKSYVY